jgi:hypothetical protein
MIPNLTIIVAAYVIIRLLVIVGGEPKQSVWIRVLAGLAIFGVGYCTYTTLDVAKTFARPGVNGYYYGYGDTCSHSWECSGSLTCKDDKCQ